MDADLHLLCQQAVYLLVLLPRLAPLLESVLLGELVRAWGWAGGTPAARHLPSVLRALATTPPEHHENRPAQMVCWRGLPHLACAARQWWPWATSALAQWRWHRHGDAPAHENPSNSLARAPKQPRPAARQEPDLAYGEAPGLK